MSNLPNTRMSKNWTPIANDFSSEGTDLTRTGKDKRLIDQLIFHWCTELFLNTILTVAEAVQCICFYVSETADKVTECICEHLYEPLEIYFLNIFRGRLFAFPSFLNLTYKKRTQYQLLTFYRLKRLAVSVKNKGSSAPTLAVTKKKWP